MDRYRIFSTFYDFSIERLYRPYRAQVATRMERKLGGTVLDLACGSGQNFTHLVERFDESTIRLVGVDSSKSMLARARRRVEAKGWENVGLVEVDARQLDRDSMSILNHDIDAFDHVVCALGFSAMPDWESIFDRAFELLRPGGQFTIFDVHAERRVIQSYWVEWLAGADVSREVWKPLEAKSTNFEMTYLDGSPHVHGGRPFLVTGFKPAKLD